MLSVFTSRRLLPDPRQPSFEPFISVSPWCLLLLRKLYHRDTKNTVDYTEKVRFMTLQSVGLSLNHLLRSGRSGRISREKMATRKAFC